jgi:hypothetical protein
MRSAFRGIPLVLAGLAVSTAGPAGASCAGPRISVSTGVVAPSGTVLIEGDGFGTDCNDTGGDGPPLGDPQKKIPVTFQQGEAPTQLGAVDADSEYQVRLSVRIPESALTGNATIALGDSPVVIVVQGPPVTAPELTAGPPVSALSTPGPVDLGDSPIGTVVIALIAAAAGALGAVLVGRVRNRHREIAT